MDDSLHDPIPGCFVSGSRNLPEPPFFKPTTTVHDQVTHACRQLPDISFTQVPLTSLSGAEFVKAWLEVVKCMWYIKLLSLLTENISPFSAVHAFLWSQNIKYCDQTIWNTMYDKSLKSPVLVDYDISMSPNFVPRTVANPFTAVSLSSDEYWNGKIEREYRHELEAFIWILSFVFLGYQNGMKAHPNRLAQLMSFSDCAVHHKHLIWSSIRLPVLEELCQPDYKDHVKLAEGLLNWMGRMDYASNPSDRYLRFEGPQNQDLPLINISNDLTSIWPAFVEQLRSVAKSFSSKLGYIDELVDDLGLESPIWVSNTS